MVTTKRPRLADVWLPEFGRSAVMPELSPTLYLNRLERLREKAEARGYGRLVIYADREHSSNLAYCTRTSPPTSHRFCSGRIAR
ncbi:MAG: hypothetical protein OEW24_00090 [Chloroflexota bacterium]|nr:hypothetical protein [Chloroflexota bacterium]